MRVRNYLDIPFDMNENWAWIVALDAWDYCEPSLLAELVLKDPIPEPLKPHISRIVSGERKPNKKAAVKLKIPATDRMKIAGSLSTVIGLIDVIKHDGKGEYSGIEACADREAKEPQQVLNELEAERERVIHETATQLGVSVETIENLLRDLRKKINEWPNV